MVRFSLQFQANSDEEYVQYVLLFLSFQVLFAKYKRELNKSENLPNK